MTPSERLTAPMRDSSLGRLVLAARHPPLWARWLLTILAFAVLTLAVVVFVHNHSEGTSAPTKSEREAEVEANREGEHRHRRRPGAAYCSARRRRGDAHRTGTCDLRRRAQPHPGRKPHGATSERALRSEGRCGRQPSVSLHRPRRRRGLPLPGGAQRAHTTIHMVQGRPAAGKRRTGSSCQRALSSVRRPLALLQGAIVKPAPFSSSQ